MLHREVNLFYVECVMWELMSTVQVGRKQLIPPMFMCKAFLFLSHSDERVQYSTLQKNNNNNQ